MGILQLPTVLPAQVGIVPATKKMVTTDNLATITASGYLNSVNLEGNPISNTDIFEVIYSYVANTNSGTFGIFLPSISNGVITLQPFVDQANVLLPVVSGNVPSFVGTTGQIQDSGIAATSVALSSISSPDPQSDLIWHDIVCSAAALAAAGKVNIQVSSGTKRYAVRDIRMNYSMSGLSGGSGDRLLQITDGSTAYSNAGITAALLQTPVNTLWGGSGNPLPGLAAMFGPTVPGSNLYAQYTGGTLDYTTGNIVISVLVQRVA